MKRYFRRWLAIFLAVQLTMMPIRQANAVLPALGYWAVSVGIHAAGAAALWYFSGDDNASGGGASPSQASPINANSINSIFGQKADRIDVTLNGPTGTSKVSIPATATAPAVPSPPQGALPSSVSSTVSWTVTSVTPNVTASTVAGVCELIRAPAQASYQDGRVLTCSSVNETTGAFNIVDNLGHLWSYSAAKSTTCPSGYTLSGSTCNLTNTRQAVPDDSEDYARSGTTYSKYSGDQTGPQYPAGVGKQETTSATNDTVSVTGKDSNGNNTKVSVIANANGGSTIQVDTQKTDANGTSYIDRKTINLDSSGNVTGGGRAAVNPGATIGITPGSTGQAPQGTTNGGPPGTAFNPGSSSGGSGSGTTFPSDYARAGEADAAATKINAKLDKLHDDLSKTDNVPDPTEPGDGDYTSPQDSFSSLLGWTVPGHSSSCPAWSFDWNGHTYSTTTHCDLFNNNAATIQTAMAVVWTVAALFIVLGA